MESVRKALKEVYRRLQLSDWELYKEANEISNDAEKAILDRFIELGSSPQLASYDEIERVNRYCKLKQDLDNGDNLMSMIIYDIDYINPEDEVAYINMAIGTKGADGFNYTETIGACQFKDECQTRAESDVLCKKCMKMRMGTNEQAE